MSSKIVEREKRLGVGVVTNDYKVVDEWVQSQRGSRSMEELIRKEENARSGKKKDARSKKILMKILSWLQCWKILF